MTPLSLGARVRFALACAATVFVFGLGTQLWSWQFNRPRISTLHTALLAAIAVVGARPLLDALARKLLGAGGPVALWRALAIATTGLGLTLASGLAYTLHYDFSFLGVSSQLVDQEPIAAAMPVLAFVAALATSGGSRTGARGVRQTAIGAVLVALALCVLGAARLARTTELQRWVESVPVRVEDHGVGGDRPEHNDSSRSYAMIQREAGAVRVGIYAFPDRSVCVGVVARAEQTLPPSVRFDDYRAQTCACRSLQIRSHERSGVIVITSSPSQHAWSISNNLALDARTGAVVFATEARIRRELSIPNAWLATSFTLALFGLALVIAPSRARRALDNLAQWTEAKLRNDRMIELANGTTVPCPYSLPLAAGTIVITEALAPRSDAGPFRDGPAAPPPRDAIYSGTIASVSAALEGSIDARHTAALFAACASASPLVAALTQGLLL